MIPVNDSKGVGRKDREAEGASHWHVSKQVTAEGGWTSVLGGAGAWYKLLQTCPTGGMREVAYSFTKQNIFVYLLGCAWSYL